jgi:hypothetical protein
MRQHDARPNPRQRALRTLFALATIAMLVAARAPEAHADPICGDATGDGKVASADALFALRSAVGSEMICPPPRCDTNRSGSITATDAMAILKSAVGLNVVLLCPSEEPDITTSTTVTSTTMVAATCGNDVVEEGEDCDSIGFCRGGCNPYTGICVDFMCTDHCTCAKPMCGDAMIDPGEACDPPDSPCGDGTGTCSASCGCIE